MSFEVRLSPDAVEDLADIYGWIAANDGAARAAHVQDRILAAIGALSQHPERGAHPKELAALGVRDFRQTYFKPYRIVYRVENRSVDVYLVADGRRDMQTLLARRLLGGE
jgi:toxin ParE1/3/4